MPANASLSQDDDRTPERVKSQQSLVVHWHRSETVTVQAPLRFTEMKMDNVWRFKLSELQISGAVQCLHTENTQIRPVVADV